MTLIKYWYCFPHRRHCGGRVRHSNLTLLSFSVCLFSILIQLDSILFVHNCSFSSFLSRLSVCYLQSRDTSPVPTWTSMKWSFLLLRHTHMLSQRTMNSKNIQSTLDQSCLSFIPLYRLNSLSQVLILQKSPISRMSQLPKHYVCPLSQ